MSLMEVQHWGPAGWQFMHAVTFGYPEQPSMADKAHALNFFKSVGYVLPCDKCRAHYNDEVKRNPPDVHSRDSLSRWLVKVHNKVNRENGKSEWSHEDVKQRHELTIENQDKKCTTPPSVPTFNSYMMIFVIGILLKLLLIFVYFNN